VIIRTVIIEDDHNMRLVLRDILKSFSFVELIGEADNGIDGLKLIETLKPNLVFLDIEMQGMDGIEIAKKITSNPNQEWYSKGKNPHSNTFIIFSTGYENFALQAFELYAFDYLTKPYKLSRIKTSLERLKNILSKFGQESAKLMVKEDGIITLIDYKDIIYIAREGRNTMIYTTHGKYKTDKTLDNLEKKMDNNFYRCHRSHIVNTKMLKEIKVKNNSKSVEIALHHASEILTAPRNKLKFLESLITLEHRILK
jgi:two-component system LytT family response regulator